MLPHLLIILILLLVKDSLWKKNIQEGLEMPNDEVGIDSCIFGFGRIFYSVFLASKSWLTLLLKRTSGRIESCLCLNFDVKS